MTPDTQLAAIQTWLATHPCWPDPNTTPRILEDPDTLRRSRTVAFPSDTYHRRAADLPREPWLDELATVTR